MPIAMKSAFGTRALATLLAFGAALGGLFYWTSALREPLPALPGPVAAVSADDPAAQALGRWFGPGEVRIDVAVNGLLKSSGQAVAVMTVDGAPPRAYRVGDAVAASATLEAIEADAVRVRRHGETLRFAVPDSAAGDPGGPDMGIVAAAARREGAAQARLSGDPQADKN